MQVLDLRGDRQRRPPVVEVRASAAAELTAMIEMVSMLAELEPGEDPFDVGRGRVSDLRDGLPATVVEVIDQTDGHLWKIATQFAGLLDAPGDVDQLVDLLQDEPERAWRAVLAQWWCDEEAEAEIIDRHLAGELDTEALVTELGDRDDLRGTVAERMLTEGPSWFGDFLLAVIRPAADALGDALAEAMGPIQREVAARQAQIADGVDTNALLVEATNGYEHGGDIPVARILLTPSYWFRPWLLIGRIEDTEVITTAVTDEHLVLPSQAPPPSLVKLCKALGDDGRLRLLRRLAGGPIQLADAMDELDVAKTTAHHHLAILRAAGLVVVRGEGRSTTYALRTDPASMVHEALGEYVGPTVRDAARASG